jgi:hypothetical protein
LFSQFATINELLAVQSFIIKKMKKSTTKKEEYKYKLINKQKKKRKIKTKAIDCYQREKLVSNSRQCLSMTIKVVASDHLKSSTKILL